MLSNTASQREHKKDVIREIVRKRIRAVIMAVIRISS
jgi:hypothetical protein